MRPGDEICLDTFGVVALVLRGPIARLTSAAIDSRPASLMPHTNDH